MRFFYKQMNARSALVSNKKLSLWKLSDFNGKKESSKSSGMKVLDARLGQRKIQLLTVCFFYFEELKKS